MNLIRLVFAGLLSLSTSSYASADSSSWSEIMLYETLLQKELKELRALPKDFKEQYQTEISQKNRSFALLTSILKIRSGMITAEGQIPDKYKINPYSSEFDTIWSDIVQKIESLPKLDCNTSKDTHCSVMNTAGELEKMKAMENIKNPDIYLTINRDVLSNNWKNALRNTYNQMEANPDLKLAYDIIQRLYSFKHQGAGKVAIKGM